MDQFFHQLRRGEGETGRADLGAEVLGVKGLVLRHGQQVEIGLLAVAEEKVFADADAQRVRNGGAGLHGLGRLVLHPAVRDVSSIDLIGAICIMLARGALISACICLFVMPAVLYVCEPMFNKTTLHWRTEQPKKESKAAKALKAASEKLPARKEKAALPEKGTEQTETTEPAEAADSRKLAAES